MSKAKRRRLPLAAASRSRSTNDTEGSVPHAYTEDAHCSVVVDGVAAVRTYFSMPGKGKAKNVLLVRFTGATEDTRRLFVATAATMSLLGSGSFKMSETPDGDFYVCTTTERDAALLDGQLYSGFGLQVAYHRVSRIEMEPRIVAMGDDAAFKLFDRDC